MMLEISQELRSTISEELARIIEQGQPNLHYSRQKNVLVELVDGFELPRIKAVYDVFCGGVYQGRYRRTIVLAKDGKEVVKVVDC